MIGRRLHVAVLTKRGLVARRARTSVVRGETPVRRTLESRSVRERFAFGVATLAVVLDVAKSALVGLPHGHLLVVARPKTIVETGFAVLPVCHVAEDAVV